MLGHWPRRTGYVLMGAAFFLSIAWREGYVLAGQRSLALLLVLLVAGIGLILVVTDRMVRAIYAQIEQAKRAQATGLGRHDEEAGDDSTPRPPRG